MENAIAPGGEKSAPRPSELAAAAAAKGVGANAPARGAGGKGRKPKKEKPSRAVSPMLQRDRRSLLRKYAVLGSVLALLFCVSLCSNWYGGKFETPAEVLSVYITWFQQAYNSVFNVSEALTGRELIAIHPYYTPIWMQFPRTVVLCVGGALLALSGALFQNTFRNPIAAPTMLGVSNAVKFGVMILVLIFSTGAAYHNWERLVLCYGVAAVSLVVLFGVGKLMGGRHKPINVVNILILGTIINSLMNVIIEYVTWYYMTWEEYEVFVGLTEVLVVDVSTISMVSITVACLLSVVPICMLRFRLNALSFDATEMKLLGVNSVALQILSLVCGTIMLVAAQLHVGTAALLSLVVPHVSRAVFGAEFRKQLVGDMLIGAIIILATKALLMVIPFAVIANPFLPLGPVVNFVVAPLFVWVVATQQKNWVD